MRKQPTCVTHTAALIIGWALPAQASDGPVGTDLTAATIKMIAVLCAVSALVVLLSVLIKKLNIAGRSLSGKKRNLEIIETLYLGPKKSLVLVRAGNDSIIVGVTPTAISYSSGVDVEPPSDSARLDRDTDTFEAHLDAAAGRTGNKRTWSRRANHLARRIGAALFRRSLA